MPVSFVNFAAASSFPAYEAATEYPVSFNAIDMAAPIPREPPVTRATLAIGVSLLMGGLVTLLQFMDISQYYFATKFYFYRRNEK